MSATTRHFYEFGACRLDSAERLLLRDNQPVLLKSKAFDVLLALIERRDHLVGKDELIKLVWPDAIVEEANLTVHISALRKALGEGENGQRFIETVPRHGYRFVAEVREVWPALPGPAADDGGLLSPQAESATLATPPTTTTPSPERASRWVRPAISSTLGLLGILIVWAVWSAVFRRVPELPPPKIVPFTAFLGNEMQPSFSPDGNQIAFVWDGEKEDNQDIYVKQLGNESLLRLTTNPAADTWPCWSPDGRYIAFTREIPEGSELYLIPSLGGAERKITRLSSPGMSSPGGGQNQMSWSPDGEWLAVRHKGSIFLVERDTGEMRKLTSPPPTINPGDSTPAFSPDGKMVAFFRRGDLNLVPTAGGEPKRLVSQSTQSLFPAWTPDGSEILFLFAMGGDSRLSLWRVPATGGTPKQVEAAGRNLDSFAVSRDGRRLAWTQSIGDENIWRMELADTASPTGPRQVPHSARLLISSTRFDASPQISPDGKKIVFVSDRSGSLEIWVTDSDGQHPVQLTFFNRSFSGSPHWSPDGRQIAFNSRAEGRGDIYLISAEGGKPRRLTTDPEEDVAPSWSRDGKSIYFCSTRSGSHRLWKMPATGGEAVMITKQGEGGHVSVESHDGHFLYYQHWQKRDVVPGIWRVPLAGGDETLILDHHRAGFWRHWTVVEQGIYFATAERPDQPLIEFFSFANGRVTPVATLSKGINPWYAGLAVSPDGRWLVWSQMDQVGNDIMLMENFR